MTSLQSIQEEIASNLLSQLDQILESGDETQLENWLSSLTEEQIDILNERSRVLGKALEYGSKMLPSVRGLPGVGTAASLGLAGYRAYQGDYTGAGLAAASALPIVGNAALAADIYRNWDKEPDNVETALNIGQAVGAIPSLVKGGKEAVKWGASKLKSAKPPAAAANPSAEKAAEYAAKIKKMDAARGNVRTPRNVPSGRPQNNTTPGGSSTTNAGVPTSTSTAMTAASKRNTSQAGPGTALVPAQSNIPAIHSTQLRPKPNPTASASKPPAGAVGAPARKLPVTGKEALTAVGIGAGAGATASFANSQSQSQTPPAAAKPATPPPGSRQQMSPGATTPKPASQAAPTVKPQARPSTSATIKPQAKPSAPPTITSKPRTQPAPTPKKQSFGFKGTATGTAEKGLSAGQTMNRALGGVYEETKPTMADFKMHIHRMMERTR